VGTKLIKLKLKKVI